MIMMVTESVLVAIASSKKRHNDDITLPNRALADLVSFAVTIGTIV